MGCDVCYTNHAEADQDDMDSLMTLLTVAGVTFLICVPGADDVMLNYQSLSHHDVLHLRSIFGVKPAPEFEAWLARMGMTDASGRLLEDGGRAPGLRQLMADAGVALTQEGSLPAAPAPVDATGAPEAPADRMPDLWAALRPTTPARIGLGRVGDTVPLRPVLDFQLAHAAARDARACRTRHRRAGGSARAAPDPDRAERRA